MIDLTPLDVRNKRGDFKRLMRGYDPQEVDVFLELVAERLEALVRENLQLRERTQTLQQQVTSQLGREQAVQDALVTAQELRADIRAQSQREAEHALKEAEAEASRMISEAEAQVRSRLRGVHSRVEGAKDALEELEHRRARFLKDFRQLLQRELDVVIVEEGRAPLEDRPIELDLGPASPSTTPHRSEPMGTAPDEPDSGSSRAPTGDGTSDEATPESAGEGPQGDTIEAVAGGDGQLRVAPDLTSAQLPSEIETPSFTTSQRPTSTYDGPGIGVDPLSASMEAEVRAEAQSQVVEVTGADAEPPTDVPRLEEVLAEAGAELTDASPEPVTRAPRTTEEIAPPSAGQSHLLYFDTDDADSR